MRIKNFPAPILIGGICLVLVAVAILFLILKRGNTNSNVSVVGDSVIQNISADYSNKVYRTNSTGKDAAFEYLEDSGVVPDNYLENSKVVREINDLEKESGNEYDTSLPSSHYFFQQYLNGLPVEGSLLGVHVRNNNEIYYVNGKVLTGDTVEKDNITLEQAVQTALEEARSEIGDAVGFENPTAEKIIYNGKLIGKNDDNRNIPAIKVTVLSGDEAVVFGKEYFISLIDGKKIDELTLIYNALDRRIFNCNNTQSSCPSARTEGAGSSGVGDVDSAYDYFGDTYNFYLNNFNRNSYDNNGAPLNGYVRFYFSQPNAAWDSTNRRMMYSSGMAVNDVTGHELTHAVTDSTAGLVYKSQSGAINEGMSDVFGWAVDQGDWTMGEDSALGVIRSLSNPPSGRQSQPDRLFASNYWCSAADNYGVHINSGILNKTFYLLVNGGAFNTCSISSIGKDRALAIFYRALSRYLTPYSNYRNLYEALIQSCNDLYGSDPGVCTQVDIASRATEIDQQPVGVQAGPTCSGQVGKAPDCSGASGGPIPTLSSPTNTPAPSTGAPSNFSISGRVFQDNNGDGVYSTGDLGLSGQNLTLSGSISDTATTLTDGTFLFPDLFAGTFNVSYGIDTRSGIVLTSQAPAVTVNIVVTKDPLNPTPTIIIGGPSVPSTPTSAPPPTTSVTRVPTPTPPTIYTCEYDPNCKSGQDIIQLCPLICREKNIGGSTPLTPTPTSIVNSPRSPEQTVTNTPVPTAPGTSVTATTAPIPTSSSTNPAKQVIDMVSSTNIENNLLSIIDDDDIAGQDQVQTRYTGLPGNTTESNYIQAKLSEYGLAVSTQNFNVGSTTTRNIIAKINGANPNDVYLITAHMDSTAQTNSGTKDPAPGADDNGSGTVAVMEAARVLKSIQGSLKSSIEFVLFSGEEQGLYGSYFYARNITSGKNIKGVINLDMIGNKGGASCVNFNYKNYNGGDVLSNKAVEMIRSYSIDLGGVSQASSNGQSDHKPFWDIGIPAIFVHECVNNWSVYHSVNDKMEFINVTQIANTAKAVSAAIADLATK